MTEPGILQVRHVFKAFGGLQALSDVSFSVPRRGIVGLIGPNGSGKTTLFNAVSGLFPPDRGEIVLDGRPIAGRPAWTVARRGLVRTFQVIRVFGQMTALENMLVAAPGLDARAEKERALALLDRVGLSRHAREYAADFSYGMTKLLEFARVLMPGPSLVLLDEPAAGVNPRMRETLWSIVRESREAGTTFVIIEHDMNVMMTLCERLTVLNYGEVIAEGPPEEVRRNKDVVEAYFGKTAERAER
ncbi:MAG: hypothetical protein A2V83_04020 [Nitrospirae bacterium RBG_16_64_22]|nr:MAG: hypothetical protein A2V83_04020 [Nitrospirae bacterium RBG_16_64_22]